MVFVFELDGTRCMVNPGDGRLHNRWNLELISAKVTPSGSSPQSKISPRAIVEAASENLNLEGSVYQHRVGTWWLKVASPMPIGSSGDSLSGIGH